jgi:hypothetical protein
VLNELIEQTSSDGDNAAAANTEKTLDVLKPLLSVQTRTVLQLGRKRAWELKQQGWKQKDIAVALGVTEGAIRKSDEKRESRGGKRPSKRTRQKEPSRVSRQSSSITPQGRLFLPMQARAYNAEDVVRV